jgi:formyl-CoA transferase
VLETQDDTAVATQPATAGGPLAGLRILELGSLIAGPYAGQLVADLGATVIKVESPERPDPMRDWGQRHLEGRSLWWPVLARNKKLVTLNLGTEEGRAMLLDLARDSDAIIENFRPGTLERWRLGYEDLRAVNPGIILVRVSGYGQTGPYARRAGFASAAEAMSGLRYINGNPGEFPPRFGISLGDSLAGMVAVQGLLAALYHRETGNGEGQVVDVSILEACFSLMESAAPEYDRLGYIRRPTGTRLPGISPSNVFRDRDGELLVIAANQDALFARLCEVMGRPELSSDPRFATHRARAEHQAEIEDEIQAWTSTRHASHVVQALAEAGVVCSRINTIAEVFADPHVREREMLVEHKDPELGSFLGPGVWPKFSRTPGEVRWSGKWEPGVDNREILGRDEQALEALRAKGVV